MSVQSETSIYEFDAGDARAPAVSLGEQLRIGATDTISALSQWQLWSMLGWNDVVQRYRRSMLGPFWITLSMAIFTVLLGVIYSLLFHIDPLVHLPYVAMGLVTFTFISGTTMEACGIFPDSAAVILQIRLPYTLHLLQCQWRNFVILMHTIVLIVPIMIFTPVDLALVNLLVIPGLILLFINQLWVAMVISVLATRFRDLAQLVDTAIRIAMFATPIMWPADALTPDKRFIVNINPLYHLVEIVRAPLLGHAPQMLSYFIVIGMCVIGFVPAFYLMYRAHRRLVYWL